MDTVLDLLHHSFVAPMARDQLYNFRLKYQLLPAEKRYEHYHRVYCWKGWNNMTLEELDKIPAIDGTVKDDMETAARLSALADGYWERYREHYGSERTSRGPELQQQAYDLLYEKLGLWSFGTQCALRDLCRWDISITKRTEIVGRVLTYIEQAKDDDERNIYLMEGVILCCLRNDDYGDNVKALALLCLGRWSPSHWGSWYSKVFSIHLGRQEWVEAENLVTRYLDSTPETEREVAAYADLGEVQIRRGKLVDGEATLQKGTERSGSEKEWIDHLSCHERLMDLFMQQERWTDAERIGRYLIRSREAKLSGGFEGTTVDWSIAARRAAQIIKISRWRMSLTYNYIHALYNDKRKLANVYTQLRNYGEAQRVLEELMEDKMHIENPILVASKELLMMVYFELGEWEKAEQLQEKIVEEMTERFGYDSEKLIPALEKLADIYQKGNRLGKRHHIKLRLLRYR